ncbi:MAG: hypothetical protein LBS88_06235 [Tannerellaceae bacterium]|nr:hypothetical protein [Tannerellaceae bacterium]
MRFEAQQVHNLCCREPLAACLIFLTFTEIRIEQVFFRRTDAEGFIVLCNLLDFNIERLETEEPPGTCQVGEDDSLHPIGGQKIFERCILPVLS